MNRRKYLKRSAVALIAAVATVAVVSKIYNWWSHRSSSKSPEEGREEQESERTDNGRSEPGLEKKHQEDTENQYVSENSLVTVNLNSKINLDQVDDEAHNIDNEVQIDIQNVRLEAEADVKAATEDHGEMRASYMRKNLKQIDKGDPVVYLAKNNITFEDKSNRLRKAEIGLKNFPEAQEKVIMLLGATGSGKTTLINAMFNYILGVQFEDKVRIKLIDEEITYNQAQSQTKTITAYTIHHQPWFTMPYTLTVIDTPGFGDTEGIERDKLIMEQTRKFFETPGSNGFDKLDAVGFVIQSSLPRLTKPQSYIFDSVISLFGKDIGENIFLMITFADGQPKPPALNAVTLAELPFRQYLTFNNGYLFESSSVLSEAFYQIGAENFESFIAEVGVSEPTSLTLTKDVLQLRHKLEDALQNIQHTITLALNTLEELEEDIDALRNHKVELEDNRYFSYETVKTGTKASCSSDHEENDDSSVVKKRKVTSNSDLVDLIKKYKEKQEDEINIDQAIEECSRKTAKVKEDILRFVSQAKGCHQRLSEIALKPHNLSVENYVDFLIETEKAKVGADLAERLAPLNRLRELCKQNKSQLEEIFDSEVNFNPNWYDETDPFLRGNNMIHKD